jgi:hypothetical protein
MDNEITLTALQYQEILMKLPIPRLEQGRKLRIEVAHIKHPINPNTIIHGDRNRGIAEYAEITSIEFELVLETLLPYWQPTKTIKIKPVNTRQYEG